MLSLINTYYEWWKKWGRIPVFSWIKASSYFRLAKYEAAQRLYKKGLVYYPDHPASKSARLDLAYCLFKLHRYDDSLEILRFLVSKFPELRDAHIRMIKTQCWLGHTLDAAWSARRALQSLGSDPELIALFIINLLNHDGVSYLLNEAIQLYEQLDPAQQHLPLVQTALAKLTIKRGGYEEGKQLLEQLNQQVNCPFEAILILAELLLNEGSVAQSRQELKRIISLIPEHPRTLGLMAESYLKSGAFYNPEYAKQLATSSCQFSLWSSPRELHILAESYYHLGDKISALVIASKAKDVGSRVLGNYREGRSLDKLIETLSSGTQA